jgi:Acyclic terpene utilisation family protein AtuA
VTNIYRVACAAGFSGDRLGVAKPLVHELIRLKGPSCLIFESLAERTLALAQLERRQNDQFGYEPLLAEMVSPILHECIRNGIPIVGNFGAANPSAAAALIDRIAKEQGIADIKIAIVEGDDIAGPQFREIIRNSLSPEDRIVLSKSTIVSANVYLGAQEIADALSAGAQVVVTGRVADPALTVGPLMAHFKKSWED